MEETEFVCTLKESTQRVLVDERHHSSHQRKHDMVLNLNKVSHFSSDETPTPTRFLRNCEAIGLFQDLQNVNPFDETFRKAAEAAKRGEVIQTLNVSGLGKPAGEDLHTPHIDLAPPPPQHHSSNGTAEGGGGGGSTVIRSEADTSLKSTANSYSQGAAGGGSSTRDGARTSEPNDLRLFVRMPDGSLVQIPTIGGGEPAVESIPPARTFIISTEKSGGLGRGGGHLPPPPVAPSPVSSPHPSPPPSAPSLPLSSASAHVRQKLKAALLKTGKTVEVRRRGAALTPPSSPRSPTDLQSPELRREKRVSSTSIEEDTERRQKTLERNRIAAMRCREKRKRWVNELRDKYNRMSSANEALAREVTHLRSEVSRLKAALVVAYSSPRPSPILSSSLQDVAATSVEIVAGEAAKGGGGVGRLMVGETSGSMESGTRGARLRSGQQPEGQSAGPVMLLVGGALCTSPGSTPATGSQEASGVRPAPGVMLVVGETASRSTTGLQSMDIDSGSSPMASRLMLGGEASASGSIVRPVACVQPMDIARGGIEAISRPGDSLVVGSPASVSSSASSPRRSSELRPGVSPSAGNSGQPMEVSSEASVARTCSELRLVVSPPASASGQPLEVASGARRSSDLRLVVSPPASVIGQPMELASEANCSRRPSELRLAVSPPASVRTSISPSLQPMQISSGGRRPSDLRLVVTAPVSTATTSGPASPLVRRDEILTSTAPPGTPNDRLLPFPDFDRVEGVESSDEKVLSSVIQVNPNALGKLPPAFS